ncbi:BLUF domain-containing protein [Leeuwenhoekiella nanhaiensis]|uniref:BLUF domain-containing protein n=1 Tax=Leeuwenhoekiella nanhaiensis TaxID=1655491 RepID=A0A2G1VUX8_9FLAO|nr:BLUF domain-containing protein [Leeuwenhoekiella nanhaiensis]PHQ30575.1 hypothetical protein CJ305_06360 [Leeuwenhoekiella nanhaiensis]
MIKYIVYLSDQSHIMKDADLELLLKNSRRKNERASITGILIHIESRFIQYIEGPEEKLNSLYEKIIKDPRHTNLILVGEGYIEKNAFATWNMAYRKLNKQALESFTDTPDPKAGFLLAGIEAKNKAIPELKLIQELIKTYN